MEGMQRMAVRRSAALAGVLLALILAPPGHAAWLEDTDAIMGTRVYVQLWADDPAQGNAAIAAVMTEMRRIDELMSHYKPESQLSLINQKAASEPVQVDPELYDLIKLSTHFSEITEGRLSL